MVDLSLLPPNATPMERAIGASFACIDTIPVPIKAVRDPALCPVPLLPWLAYHHSVDEWDPDWPEPTKRQVIDQAYAIKAHKGTRWAVMTAIRAQGFANVSYQTWFEYGGNPYCFRLSVQLDDATTKWTAANDALLVRTALKSKSVRSKLDAIAIVRGLPQGPVGIASAIFVQETVTLLVEVPSDIPLPPSSVRIASGISITETLTFGHA